MMSLTGGLMVLSTVIYSYLQPATALTIPFEDAYIKFGFGWCFWMVAISG